MSKSTVKKKAWENFEEFWPFYLSEHDHPLNRRLHVLGTSVGIVVLILGVLAGYPWSILIALACGYGAAWVGHFIIEKNRPATFVAPFYSLRGDFRLWWRTITGRSLR